MSFSLLGIRIRVAPSFLLFQAGLAVFVSVTITTTTSLKALAFVIIGAVVLVSVLVHEMGHALAAKNAGLRPEITLTWFGGFTRFVANVGPGRRLWISAAGVIYQAGMAAGVWLLIRHGFLPDDGLIRVTADAFVWFNLLMAGVNLVPVGGMDGGAIVGSLLELLRVPRPRLVLLFIYGIGGFAITLWAISARHWFIAFAGLYLTFAGVRAQSAFVQYEQDHRSNPELEPRVRRGLLMHRFGEVADLADEAIQSSDSAPFRVFATAVLLDALRLDGQTERLASVVSTVSRDGIDAVGIGQALTAAGNYEDAVKVLLPSLTEDGNQLAAHELAKTYLAGGNPEAAAAVVGYRPDLFHPLLGLDVHARLMAVGAVDQAAAVREIMSAQRRATPGASAHMLIKEGAIEAGLAIIKRNHELSANATSAAWLDYGLDIAATGDRSVMVGTEDSPGRIDTTSGPVLVYLLSEAGRHDRAAEIGLELIPPEGRVDDVLLFNVASALDRCSRPAEAVALLDRASPLFLLRALAEEDDFAASRDTAEYASLVEKVATTLM